MKPEKIFSFPASTEICVQMSRMKKINSLFLGFHFNIISRRLIEYFYLLVLFSQASSEQNNLVI